MMHLLATATHVVLDALPAAVQEPFWAREVFWVAVGSVASVLLSAVTIRLVFVTGRSVIEAGKATALQEIHNARAIAPFIVAEEFGEPPTPLYMTLRNVGPGLAMNVRYSCIQDGHSIPAAGTFGPPIASGGRYRTEVVVSNPGVKRLRIRYDDALGNAYITEYPIFDRAIRAPRYRVPWWPGSAKPILWSGELSWEFEHFEHVMRYPEETFPEQQEHLLDAPAVHY
jgi:hypothetical protein